MSTNPFTSEAASVPSDEELVAQAVAGDRASLEQLLLRHQPWIFNIAVRMVYGTEDAEDVTQEVLIKVVTKLSAFRGESAFRTWLYRIVANHVLSMRRRTHEQESITFTDFGNALDNMPDLDPPDSREFSVDAPMLVEEAKLSCLAGMLLCLDRRQRLVYTLAELFGVNASLGGEILETSAENFRQILSRARRDLYQFMQGKCGLVNEANPCRCRRKTRAFIDAGFVDPQKIRFAERHVSRVRDLAPATVEALEDFEDRFREVHRDTNFLGGSNAVSAIQSLLSSDALRQNLLLDQDS